MTDKTKILILGATGPLGVQTVRAALRHDYHVTIYARNPAKLPHELIHHSDVTVVAGELSSTDKLYPLISSVTAVVSNLGPTGLSHKGTAIADFYRDLLAHLHTIPNPPRLIVCGTISIYSPHDRFSFLRWLMVLGVRTMAYAAYNEFVTTAEIFNKEAKDLPWTIFRVAILSDAPGVGVAKAGYVGDRGFSVASTRYDIAEWSIREIKDRAWIGKMPAIWGGEKVQ